MTPRPPSSIWPVDAPAALGTALGVGSTGLGAVLTASTGLLGVGVLGAATRSSTGGIAPSWPNPAAMLPHANRSTAPAPIAARYWPLASCSPRATAIGPTIGTAWTACLAASLYW